MLARLHGPFNSSAPLSLSLSLPLSISYTTELTWRVHSMSTYIEIHTERIQIEKRKSSLNLESDNHNTRGGPVYFGNLSLSLALFLYKSLEAQNMYKWEQELMLFFYFRTSILNTFGTLNSTIELENVSPFSRFSLNGTENYGSVQFLESWK